MTTITETTTTTDIQTITQLEASPLIRDTVAIYLRQYFNQLLDHTLVNNLYAQVMSEIEPPLLEMTLRYCGNNQVRTAKLLAISRGTLRKKMQQYGMLKNK